jgi:hypothetical protein
MCDGPLNQPRGKIARGARSTGSRSRRRATGQPAVSIRSLGNSQAVAPTGDARPLEQPDEPRQHPKEARQRGQACSRRWGIGLRRTDGYRTQFDALFARPACRYLTPWPTLATSFCITVKLWGRIYACSSDLFAALIAFAPVASAKGLTDAQVRKEIIKESIAEYQASGHPCACPYNSAKNGSSCGKRSAYSRPGGAAPLCFDKDVTDSMVADWRRQHNQ